MRTIKTITLNSVFAAFLLFLYNAFFFMLHYWYAHNPYYLHFLQLSLGKDVSVFYDVFLPLLFLSLYVLSWVAFYCLGKYAVASSKSRSLDLVSVLIGCVGVFVLLRYAYVSEYTSLVFTNFIIICLAELVNSETIAVWGYSWSMNLCFSIIPCLCICFGVLLKKPKLKATNKVQIMNV